MRWLLLVLLIAACSNTPDSTGKNEVLKLQIYCSTTGLVRAPLIEFYKQGVMIDSFYGYRYGWIDSNKYAYYSKDITNYNYENYTYKVYFYNSSGALVDTKQDNFFIYNDYTNTIISINGTVYN